MGFVYAYCITKGIRGTEISTKSLSIAEDNRVKILSFIDVQAVISIVEASEFSKEAVNKNLDNLFWVEEKAMEHENIIEEIMEKFTVLPLRFLTIYENEENIMDLLKNHYSKIKNNLRIAENNYEFGIKVFCNKEIINKSKPNSVVNQMKTSSDAEYILRKIDSLAENIILKDIENENYRSSEMVLNAVVLVNKGKYKAIEQEFNNINAKFGKEGYLLKESKPWPMYSFIELI